MTNLIETLARRLDAENCVYELSNEAAVLSSLRVVECRTRREAMAANIGE